MKKFPKPWYRPSRGAWYVTLGGRQHNLGADRANAFESYKRLLNRLGNGKPVNGTSQSENVVCLIDRFLDWCKDHRASETFEWYRWRLQLFVDSIDKALLVANLKHHHIDTWLQGNARWSNGTKHGMARALQRVMRWAARKGHIDRSPIADYEKARPGKRNRVISAAEFDQLQSHVRQKQFHDLLTVAWETGCRPQELLAVEGRHVDLARARWVFPPDESKGQQWPRVVYLPDKALGITTRLMQAHPHGPLFQNKSGRPWTADAVNCAFTALQQRMGRAAMKRGGIKLDDEAVQSLIPKLKARARFNGASRLKTPQELKQEARLKIGHKLAAKYAPKYCLYNLRHSWLDRALKSGVDPLTCAILMGHRDPSTISKVYQHLAQSPDYMRNAAKKAAS